MIGQEPLHKHKCAPFDSETNPRRIDRDCILLKYLKRSKKFKIGTFLCSLWFNLKQIFEKK